MMFLIAALFGNIAHASDTHIYGGANCTAWGGSVTMSYGRIYNGSTSTTAYVDCPVDHDTVLSVDATESSVKVVDNSSSANITCDLYGASMTGSTLSTTKQRVTSSSSSSSVQTLTFTSDFSSSYNWYWVTCSLPPMTSSGSLSYVVSYTVDED